MIIRTICKFLLRTIGKWLPTWGHPGGKIANRIRSFLTRGIVKQMGKECIIEKGANLMEDCVLGDYTGIGIDCLIGRGTIFKGYCMMGPNVRIYTSGHNYSLEEHRFVGMRPIDPVHIGEKVWIGDGVIILPGVTIGDHTIIGAGSVVAHDIPSGVVAAGNPCVVKKVLDPLFYEIRECQNLSKDDVKT